MRETATSAQRHAATTMVVEARCTPISRPRRLVMTREGACEALGVTETATYRRRRGSLLAARGAFRLGIRRSASNHQFLSFRSTRLGGGSGAPLRRAYLLCGPAAATQWQNAAPVEITKTTGPGPEAPARWGAKEPRFGLRTVFQRGFSG